MNSAISSGTHLGRYKILSQLGVGGMGEVYLAKDTELGRKVALKILPASFAQDKQRMLRFIQEARTASNLSHPNVAHIYEVMEADGSRLIVMEYVEGETLRQRLASRRLEVGDALETAAQMASALVAAHASGIIHRDIKPENIMLRTDGFVKVLDFGLAKLDVKSALSQASDADASTLIKTDPGIVMGTVSYMSPEQARGLPVDERTDIFSLGVVLYEMVAGRRPFEGATTSDVIVSILERQPAPLVKEVPEASDELKELNKIVLKALEKDAEERYQTIKDMAVDLRKLRRRLDVKAEMERSAPPETSSVEVESGSAAVERSQGIADARTSLVSPAAPTSSVEYLVSEMRRHKKGTALVGALFVIVVASMIYGLYRFSSRSESKEQKQPNAPIPAMKFAKLTSSGKAKQAAISPDGKYIVHVMDEGGKSSLWLRNVATSSSVQIVPPAEVKYYGITFSKDANFIYYNITDAKKFFKEIYQVPVLGGAPRKVLSDVLEGITFSPDGKKFAFSRSKRTPEEFALVVANADGTGERELVTHEVSPWYGVPAWSPDGKIIACTVGYVSEHSFYMGLVAVSAENGAEVPISSQQWGYIFDVAWLGDGSGLLISAEEKGSSLQQIWQVSYPGGEAHRVTNDLNQYSRVSMTADSSALVTVQSQAISNIWIAPNGNESLARQITTGGDVDSPAWTPDGKVLYRSAASGNLNIWMMEADGTGQKQLTFFDNSYPPVVTPDGRYIIYTFIRDGVPLIGRSDINGGNPKQLTNRSTGTYDFPAGSPDGQWVVYAVNTGRQNLWKVRIDGGDPAQLTDADFVRSPVVSPDGKLIACYYTGRDESVLKLALIPFDGGQPIKVFDIPSPTVSAFQLPLPRWTSDGRAVAYIDTRGGISNIWAQPIDGGSPKQLTNFKTDLLFSFDWSRDGRQLALARGTITNDVVQISNFK